MEPQEVKEEWRLWMRAVQTFEMQRNLFVCVQTPALPSAVKPHLVISVLPLVREEDLPGPPSHAGKPSWLPIGL